jgi:hypothetical protein
VLSAVLRSDEASGRHDGVGQQRPVLQRPSGLQDARERLLHEIVDQAGVGHPGGNDAAYDRLQHGDVGRVPWLGPCHERLLRPAPRSNLLGLLPAGQIRLSPVPPQRSA